MKTLMKARGRRSRGLHFFYNRDTGRVYVYRTYRSREIKGENHSVDVDDLSNACMRMLKLGVPAAVFQMEDDDGSPSRVMELHAPDSDGDSAIELGEDGQGMDEGAEYSVNVEKLYTKLERVRG